MFYFLFFSNYYADLLRWIYCYLHINLPSRSKQMKSRSSELWSVCSARIELSIWNVLNWQGRAANEANWSSHLRQHSWRHRRGLSPGCSFLSILSSQAQRYRAPCPSWRCDRNLNSPLITEQGSVCVCVCSPLLPMQHFLARMGRQKMVTLVGIAL